MRLVSSNHAFAPNRKLEIKINKPKKCGVYKFDDPSFIACIISRTLSTWVINDRRTIYPFFF